jgi:hypothetical protein
MMRLELQESEMDNKELQQVKQYFDRILLDKPSPTVTFRRFDPLSVPQEHLGLLTRVLLGMKDEPRMKQGNAILNDALVVNLACARGHKVHSDLLNKFEKELNQIEEKKMNIDVSEELADLWKVYTDAYEHLKTREEQSISTLVLYMKHFIEIYEEKKSIGHKLNTLSYKVKAGSSDDEDEGDDE